MLLRNLKHLLINLRHEGMRETLRRLFFRFLRINSFYVFSLDLLGFNLPVSAIIGVRVEEVMQQDLHELRKQYENLPSEFYIDKLEPKKNYRSFVGFVHGLPAIIFWLCAGQSSELVKIGSKDVEMNHIHCRAEYRGRKLLQHMIHIIAPQMREEGFCEIITVVHSDNIASIKTMERCGFKRVGLLKRIGLFVWKAQ